MQRQKYCLTIICYVISAFLLLCNAAEVSFHPEWRPTGSCHTPSVSRVANECHRVCLSLIWPLRWLHKTNILVCDWPPVCYKSFSRIKKRMKMAVMAGVRMTTAAQITSTALLRGLSSRDVSTKEWIQSFLTSSRPAICSSTKGSRPFRTTCWVRPNSHFTWFS